MANRESTQAMHAPERPGLSAPRRPGNSHNVPTSVRSALFSIISTTSQFSMVASALLSVFCEVDSAATTITIWPMCVASTRASVVGEQRRRVEDDDAVRVARREVAQQPRHALARQQLGGAARGASRPAAAMSLSMLVRSSASETSISSSVSRSSRPGAAGEPSSAGKRGMRDVAVDEQHRVVEFHRDAHREVDRGEGLAFAGQRAGHHDQVAVADPGAVAAAARCG